MLKQTVQRHVMAVNDTFTVDFEYSFSKAVNAISKSLRNGGKLIFCGNGGSAGDSQHISAEFVSKLQKDRATASHGSTITSSPICPPPPLAGAPYPAFSLVNAELGLQNKIGYHPIQWIQV